MSETMVDTSLSEPRVSRVPPSLLQTCLQFVACNLQLVDSLVGFPEIMGQRLFLEAIKRRQFEPLSQTNDSFWNLKLFQDAYGALVLEKLQLKGDPVFVLEQVPLGHALYSSLTQLDLAGCMLGHHESQLRQLAHMTNLTHLGLRDNRLTESTLQLMTTPARVRSEGLVNLEVLDLSCNPCVTGKALRYLGRLGSMTFLDLSGTAVKTSECSDLCTRLGLAPFRPAASATYRPWTCGIRGWAAPVLHSWLRQCRNETEARTKAKAKGFYGRRPHERPSPRCPPSDPVLVLSTPGCDRVEGMHRPSLPSVHQGSALGQSRKRQGLKKRKMTSSDVLDDITNTSDSDNSDEEIDASMKDKRRRLEHKGSGKLLTSLIQSDRGHAPGQTGVRVRTGNTQSRPTQSLGQDMDMYAGYL